MIPAADTPAGPMWLDALLPPAMARRAEEIGVAKAAMEAGRLLALAMLAGAFIAFGAIAWFSSSWAAPSSSPATT